MKYVNRIIEGLLHKYLKEERALLLSGPRRTGKTELLKHFLNGQEKPFLLLNGEDMETADVLAQRSRSNYQRLLDKYEILAIDEAHAIPDIGSISKFLVDSFPSKRFILTGSSAFELTGNTGQPLTGRKVDLHLYPLAQCEIGQNEDLIQTRARMEEHLLYGGYPRLEQMQDWTDKQRYLEQLVQEYLFQDILKFEQLRNANKLKDLLRLLAFQVGSEVSINELSQSLQVARATVERYLDLLAKVFVVFKLPAFSRNLHKEIAKSDRWYFWDNGIRNAIIRNFNQLSLRQDQGQLWENYIVSERLKKAAYQEELTRFYFWRTYDQQEIDLIEEEGGQLLAYELKWGKKKAKVPAAWAKTYPHASFQIVHPGQYLDYIGA